MIFRRKDGNLFMFRVTRHRRLLKSRRFTGMNLDLLKRILKFLLWLVM